MKLIATYVNLEGNTISLLESGLLRLYTKENKEWVVKSEFPFFMNNRNRLIEVRALIQELVQKLEGCKVFVAEKVTGQLYYILEANGFNTYEAEGKPEYFLNSIWEEQQLETVRIAEAAKNRNDNKTCEAYLYPMQTEKEGEYFINLKQALLVNATTTSKKLLLPFLRRRQFNNLDIICDHVPRWIKTELISLELSSTVTVMKENEYKVRIANSSKE